MQYSKPIWNQMKTKHLSYYLGRFSSYFLFVKPQTGFGGLKTARANVPNIAASQSVLYSNRAGCQDPVIWVFIFCHAQADFGEAARVPFYSRLNSYFDLDEARVDMTWRRVRLDEESRTKRASDASHVIKANHMFTCTGQLT